MDLDSKNAATSKYQYSVPAAYNSATYPSAFLPRISKSAEIADRASKEFCRNLELEGYGHSVNPACVNPVSGNGVALYYPEALPERLGIITYIFEYAFLNDGNIFEAHGGATASDHHTKHLEDSLKATLQTGVSHSARKVMKERIVARLLQEDEVLGKLVIEEYELHIRNRGRGGKAKYDTLDEYIAFRYIDAATDWYTSVIRYALDLTISPTGLASIHPVASLSLTIANLWNDYYSWEKEYKAYTEAKDTSTGHLVNAVNVLMRLHNTDAPTAKEILRKELADREVAYIAAREKYERENQLSLHATRYLDAIEDMLAGNIVWSETTDRYKSGG